MRQTVANYRWSVENFLRAWEADAFDGRVELIDGEIWPVVIGVTAKSSHWCTHCCREPV